MSRITFQKLSFNKLRAHFNEKVLAVPELQRNYVWNKTQVCDLLDSIYNHYPIGVWLIWRASNAKVVEIRTHNKTIIPAYNHRNKFIEFIIDGQQRLSSLYGVLHGINSQIDSNAKLDFQSIYFNLDKTADKRFIYLKKVPANSNNYLVLSELLSERPSKLIRRYRLSQAFSKELIKCYKQFASYHFFFLKIETDSLEEVRETFIRINSKGMTVSRADALFAKTTNIGLRDLVESTRRSLNSNGFNQVPPRSFIYTLALANDETRIGAMAMESFYRRFERENIGKAQFQKTWKKYNKAFTSAKDFLQNNYAISEYRLLPSDNIYTMLSLFFYLNNKRLTPFQRTEINRWFWHTVLGERYSGAAFNRNIPKDISFFKQLSTRNIRYHPSEKINSIDFLKKDYKSSNRSSAVAGYFLFLRLNKPRYLENGDLMILDGAAAIANRKDKHHIFPQDLLRRKRISSKWIHSLANICLVAANENQSISNNHPKDYLQPFKKNRFFPSVMKSHLIPTGYDKGLWNGHVKDGFKAFLNERSMLLLSAIETFAGYNRWELFEKFDKISRVI